MLSVDFSAQSLQVRREWNDILKVLKGENQQSKIIYPARLSFRIGKRKKLSDKQKLKEFINTKSTLKYMLKGLV